MYQLTYHFKSPYFRKYVDLCKYEHDLQSAITKYPMVRLNEVTKNSYTITVNTSDNTKKNNIMRRLGHTIAETSLRFFVTRGITPKGVAKNELFIEKKPVDISKNQSSLEQVNYDYAVYTQFDNGDFAFKPITYKILQTKEETIEYLGHLFKEYLYDKNYRWTGFNDCDRFVENALFKHVSFEEAIYNIIEYFIDCLFAYIEENDETGKNSESRTYRFGLYPKSDYLASVEGIRVTVKRLVKKDKWVNY